MYSISTEPPVSADVSLTSNKNHDKIQQPYCDDSDQLFIVEGCGRSCSRGSSPRVCRLVLPVFQVLLFSFMLCRRRGGDGAVCAVCRREL